MAPKAKSVIWLFMVGGASQMETFDPKPELNKHAGKTIAESPYKATLDSPYLKKNISLAYVPPAHSEIGHEVFVEIRGQKIKCKVVPTPFYKRPKKS